MGQQSTGTMHISLVIVSVFFVGVAESISCFNCTGTSDDTRAGKTSNCRYTDGNGGASCTGDFCLVTTLYYDDPFNAPPITIVWRQCGQSASLPSGVDTGQCAENNATFKQTLYEDRNLCCYRLKYNQTLHQQYLSNVTYCFCAGDNNCNDLLFRPGFTPFTPGPTHLPGVSTIAMQTSIKPSSITTAFNLSGILVSVYVIPIASTAVVSVLMILSAVCLWKMSA